MFIPKYYKVTDFKEITNFINENSFGTLVTIKNEIPIATHIPLLLNQEGEDYFITGHMAYGNPAWRTFEACKEVLVMFQGPHAYISSSWYGHENVPTWNYQAVHVYGKASILDKEELVQDLTLLLEKYEANRENPILWDTLSPELLAAELKGIVGFKIKIREVQASYKMSQNRNEVDYRNIVAQLQNEPNADSHRMAEAMKKREEFRGNKNAAQKEQ
ncbi:FMN-binding negative transcriptional regulator [Metasolibacillus sp. FSL H7-0170]|uniref:FMN-binding negative transcriptional regulator n=1 Tax=Metasolibacillus sp. FSL H7-0170 TaxID=2921431 RepID=UPI0031597D25